MSIKNLKEIGFKSSRDHLDDKFSEIYEALICFGDWINDAKLEKIYNSWDEDLLSQEQLKGAINYYSDILNDLQDEGLEAPKYQHNVYFGYPNALGGY